MAFGDCLRCLILPLGCIIHLHHSIIMGIYKYLCQCSHLLCGGSAENGSVWKDDDTRIGILAFALRDTTLRHLKLFFRTCTTD